MRKAIIKYPLLLLSLYSFLLLGLPASSWAQQPTADSTQVQAKGSGKIPITQRDYSNTEIEMADAWRANGKIYVVVATISALLTGLVIFLIFLERRIDKLEKEVLESNE